MSKEMVRNVSDKFLIKWKGSVGIFGAECGAIKVKDRGKGILLLWSPS